MLFNTKKVLVTGASGLIGSEVSKYFLNDGYTVIGVDNNMRKHFFGDGGDTSSVTKELCKHAGYIHKDCDIRDSQKILEIFEENRPSYIVHAAAQPSHDLAAKIPHEDFHTNATGTLNILEAARQKTPESPLIHVSTNKVYGDTPNRLALVEKETRFDYIDEKYKDGIDELMSIDQTTHSLFGVSKTAGDLLAQEYARYFNMPIGIFRGGCLTGPQHAGVELHGFLSYIVKCAVQGKHYVINGYKGKQVRDQIHSYDVCTAFHEFIKSPKSGEVYNIGGCRQNSASILEIIQFLNEIGHKLDYELSETARIGDHICYISNMNKFKSHYPNWQITKNLKTILSEIVESAKFK